MKAILRKIGAANRTQAAMWASDRMTPAPRTYGILESALTAKRPFTHISSQGAVAFIDDALSHVRKNKPDGLSHNVQEGWGCLL